MAVRARLDGDPYDLATLLALFTDGDIEVGTDDDSLPYYLASPRLDGYSIHSELNALHQTAQQIVLYVNGAARACIEAFRPVRLAGRYNDDGDRSDVHVLVQGDEVLERDQGVPTLTDEEGQVLNSVPPAASREYGAHPCSRC